MRFYKLLLVFLTISIPQLGVPSDDGVYFDVDTYPKGLKSDCRDGVAKLYDECGSQMSVLEDALARANESDKTLIIMYGAEWCIWCHVFDKYVKGQHKNFSYKWEFDGEMQEWDMREKANRKTKKNAKRLNQYVSENFVVAHIEGHFSPDGVDVIEKIGFDGGSITFLPFIFSVTRSGEYADHMLAADAIPGLEIRKNSRGDYRGFDRRILLDELIKLEKAAVNLNPSVF